LISNLRGKGTFIAYDLPTPELQEKFITALRVKGVESTGCGSRYDQFIDFIFYLLFFFSFSRFYSPYAVHFNFFFFFFSFISIYVSLYLVFLILFFLTARSVRLRPMLTFQPKHAEVYLKIVRDVLADLNRS
jgi:4-aminobutyrate aminotransferase-like enzyme